MLAVTLAGTLLLTRFVAIPWAVAGPSMEPTLGDGDRVVVDLWSYRRRAPRPGEVALLYGPGGTAIVKRIAGGPEDPEEIPVRSPFRPVKADEPWFRVSGDNGGLSQDSRSFGPVPQHLFRGRVVWRYWPLDRIGPIR